jgi:DnaD/phage-associated family protein
MCFTPLPNLFFSHLLPQINDLIELKVLLHIFWILYQKRGYPKFVTFGELAADKTLMRGIDEVTQQALRHALNMAVDQGILLYSVVDEGGERQELYFINTEASRQAVAKLGSGAPSLGGALPLEEPQMSGDRADIFTLYEQNIGLVTPLISEELKEAERLYPFSWIEQAFREAVSLNKRNWRYICRILERWSMEGKEDGESGGNSTQKASPSRYLKGKYGHLVKH